MPDALPTVDLEGVEILSTGGPVRAIGSPPEGDFWTTEQLRAMVDASHELGDEVKAPARIGHRRIGEPQETALRSSPAVGWLANLRLNQDGTKLLADIKQVPARFAELVRAGAWRARSSELSRITSQRTGKTYENVVTGLAWLGDKLPAVQTLDDVVSLYEGRADRQLLCVYENPVAPELVDKMLELLFGAVAEASAGSDERPADTRAMAKFTAEQRKTFAEATGLEADKVTDEMLEKAGLVEAPAEPAVSDEKALELAKALGVEVADGKVNVAKLLEAANAKADGDNDDESGGEDERYKALEQRLEAAEKRSSDTAEELRVERRDGFVEAAITAGKIAPGARAKLERLYDRDPEGAREFVAEVKPNEELLREFGSDAPTPGKQSEQETIEKAYEADLASRLGVKAEELI